MVIAFFQNLLGAEDVLYRSVPVEELRGLISYRCPQAIADQLTVIPSEEEIKTSLFTMPKNKAPWPDGFAAEFFWESWEVVGKDLIDAIRDFFLSGRMMGHFNNTAISLIPKVVGADQLTMFRPISLCSTI